MKNFTSIFTLLLILGGSLMAGEYTSPHSPVVARARAFYTSVVSQQGQACQSKNCVRTLEVCPYDEDHTYCPECHGKCLVCSQECSICLDEHEQIDEVVLACHHHFGKGCLAQWRRTQKSATCPLCRGAIIVKGEETCGVCHDVILPSEKSKVYSCTYRPATALRSCHEKHVFHDRCITEYAERTAFRDKKGNVLFQCPCMHTYDLSNTQELWVSLGKVAPTVVADRGAASFPELQLNAAHTCELCHKLIYRNQTRKEYTCKWAPSFGLRKEKKHLFHDQCLRSYVERSAYKRTYGRIFFYCPGFHEGSVEWHGKGDLEIPVFPDYTPQRTFKDVCCICKEQVDPHAEETRTWNYTGYPPGRFYLNMTKIDEQLYLHVKCLNQYIARKAYKWKPLWGSDEYYVPCPLHTGTSLSHEYKIPKAHIVIAP